MIHAHFPPLKRAHLPCFKVLWINPISTSKLVHENSTTNTQSKAIETTLSQAWGFKGSVNRYKYINEQDFRWDKM
jgi:hypothetical protein